MNGNFSSRCLNISFCGWGKQIVIFKIHSERINNKYVFIEFTYEWNLNFIINSVK
jgi:hypothetical protein